MGRWLNGLRSMGRERLFYRPLPSRLAPGLILVFTIVFPALLNRIYAGDSATETGPGYHSQELPVPTAGRTGFTLLTPTATGVLFTNSLATERSITNHVLLNGSGVAAGDVDGDRWVDLYFCGLDGPNKLFRNLGNWHFEDVTDRAGVACPGLDATGAALADIDGDGDLDLIVNSVAGGTYVFLNDGHGHFTLSPGNPRLNEHHAGTSLALADMDGDGLLDLYIANYRPMFFFLDKAESRYSLRMANGVPHVMMIDGRPLTDPEFTNRFVFQVHMANGKVVFGKEELGEVDQLYHNDGQGRFTLVPFTGGAFLDEEGKPLSEPPRDWGLSVVFRDLNGDGFPDIYVCNDFRTPDRVWLNDGHGRFRAMPRLGLRQTCLSAMGMDVADINRDGNFDLFVVDMLSPDHTKRLNQRIDLRPELLLPGQIDNRPQFSRNMLQLSRGDGTFAEIGQYAGLEAADWAWSPLFLDVDLDGYEDVLVSNGFERDTMSIDAQNKIEALARQQKLSPKEKMNLRRMYPRIDTSNRAFRNLGNCRFVDVSAAWGFDTHAISQGTCLADLDNDGDLDVIVNNFNGPAGLYRNETTAPRLAIRLKGQPPNTRGIGAKIEVKGGPVYQSQEMVCGGRYCSSDDPMRVFAAGSMTNELLIKVSWRSGKHSIVEHARANRLYEIEEPTGAKDAAPDTGTLAQERPATHTQNTGVPTNAMTAPTAEARSAVPLFRDASRLLNHTHHDEPFDDFARQPLLPGKLSQLGPGVCWFDLDQDGWEDLIIGSGRGGPIAAYRNTGKGSFARIPSPILEQPSTVDLTAIVGRRAGGAAELFVGRSSYEGDPNTAAVRLLRMNFGGPSVSTNFSDLIPGAPGSTGPLALADVDGDGTLDLFVGARVLPGRYPESGASRLFLNRRGRFELDSTNSAVPAGVGMVSGAVFSDLDGDGRPDLVLTCEWGPVRVFRNERGQLVEATKALGLDRFIGWWTGVATGDFDGDGKLDIVACNWGRNSRYEHFRSKPLRLYNGDFNGDGGVQVLEAYFDEQLGSYVPWRRLDDAAKSMPFLSARFDSFEAFGRASVEQILGDRFGRGRVLEANWLETTVFLNRGDHFEPVVLPLEAQLAPAFAACVADFDGDGHEDIVLSQNFFAVQTEMSRYDAGRGLLLRGLGNGQFEAVPGQTSGLLVYGEQRGAAVCDYDHDGRPDLVITQNSSATKLFHNQNGRPGMRVQLKGPAENLEGIGAKLRVVSGGRAGPVREIHAGCGYWSQDAATQVFAKPDSPAQLQVQWPWGKTVLIPVPSDVDILQVDPTGQLRPGASSPAP